MKYKLGVVFILLFLLTSCSADVTPTQQSTATIFPTNTAPTSSEDCPVLVNDTSPRPKFDPYDFLYLEPAERNSFILGYLNHYGVDSQILENQTQAFVVTDLTEDGDPEIIYIDLLRNLIYGCLDREYQLLFESRAYGSRSQLEFIHDVNQNGFPEVAINLGYLSQGGHFYEVVEWDGSHFRDVFPDRDREINATGTISYADMDGDGIQKLIINSGIYSWGDLAWNYGPWRNVTKTYEWDGNHYVASQETWDPPEYRFQAVQDGDRLFLAGKYDDALVMYLQAISSTNLKWWSPEIRYYEDAERQAAYSTATLPAPPAEDLNEYVALAAYSYFRLMQVYLHLNQPVEAEETYQNLQSTYANDPYGKAFAEMATAFWDEYIATQNIASACQSAIAYTEDHPEEILRYLGNSDFTATYYGFQSLDYTPESVCPVK